MHGHGRSKEKVRERERELITEEDYRQELIRQKIKQKYKRSRQSFMSKNFLQYRSKEI